MTSMGLAEIAAAAQALPPDEQRQLWELLVELSEQREERAKHQDALQQGGPHQGVLQKMLEDGLVTRIPPPIANYARHRNWTPVEVQGKPLSETIIEERR